ncbi:MAG: M42 family peptidase, partial [Clostridia bacterium]
MDIFSYLEGMTTQLGPSGQEREVSAWLRERFAPLCDSVTTDALYNVIALKKATLPMPDGSPAPRVMLSAHQDEIALMVADILPDGTLRMGQVGGVDPRILPASTVTVHGRDAMGQPVHLLGVVGATPPHLLASADRENNYKREDLFIDLGMQAEKVRAQVHIGDLVTLIGPATRLLNERAAAKTMDDRACVGVLLEAAERLKRMSHLCDVYFVCSSQEEVGSKGAATAAYTIDPDLAVVLDV